MTNILITIAILAAALFGWRMLGTVESASKPSPGLFPAKKKKKKAKKATEEFKSDSSYVKTKKATAWTDESPINSDSSFVDLNKDSKKASAQQPETKPQQNISQNIQTPNPKKQHSIKNQNKPSQVYKEEFPSLEATTSKTENAKQQPKIVEKQQQKKVKKIAVEVNDMVEIEDEKYARVLKIQDDVKFSSSLSDSFGEESDGWQIIKPKLQPRTLVIGAPSSTLIQKPKKTLAQSKPEELTKKQRENLKKTEKKKQMKEIENKQQEDRLLAHRRGQQEEWVSTKVKEDILKQRKILLAKNNQPSGRQSVRNVSGNSLSSLNSDSIWD